MSAELYDAEIAGALARPAIDVLPQASAKKAKTDTDVAGAELAAASAEAPLAEASAEEAAADVVFAPPSEATAEPATAIVPEPAEDAPRKVFGIALGRGRRAKATEEVVDVAAPQDSAPEGSPSEATDTVPVAITSDVTADVEIASGEITATIDPFAPIAPAVEPAGEVSAPQPATAEVTPEASPFAAAAPAPTVAAPVPDHTEEVRAMRALLEASEQVRQAAEQRTADAEAQLRTMTNSVQEWQIRHREAEATITELAGSLAGAEGRMSELAQRLAAAEAERDELVSALDAATSPAT